MPLNPVPNYRASLDSLPDPTTTTYEDDDGFEIDLLLQKHNAILELLENILGISEASAQDSPLANMVLASSTNGKSKWRQVATGDIAANAVTQLGAAVGSSSSPTTTSNGYADLTDMSVTLTTTGGDLEVFFSGSFYNSGANNIVVGLSLDGAAEVCAREFTPGAANLLGVISMRKTFTGVSAASHTVKARWKVGAGTGTAYLTERDLEVKERKR